jgi:hypothetical protein
MPVKPSSLAIPLPRIWSSRIQKTILDAIALAQYALVHAQNWTADRSDPCLPHLAELDQANQEIALLREQL